jgi:predicted ester cyclase
MSTEGNKMVVRRYLEELWGKGNLAAENELVDKNIVDHNPLPNQVPGLEGHHRALQLFHSAFRDIQLRIEFLIGEGDKVVDHWTMSAIHSGEFLGLPATNRSFTITGTDASRVAGGKIVEVWHVEDILGMMQQIGAILSAPGARPQMNQPSTQTGRPSMGRTDSGAGMPMGS